MYFHIGVNCILHIFQGLQMYVCKPSVIVASLSDRIIILILNNDTYLYMLFIEMQYREMPLAV